MRVFPSPFIPLREGDRGRNPHFSAPPMVENRKKHLRFLLRTAYAVDRPERVIPRFSAPFAVNYYEKSV